MGLDTAKPGGTFERTRLKQRLGVKKGAGQSDNRRGTAHVQGRDMWSLGKGDVRANVYVKGTEKSITQKGGHRP